MKGKQKEKKKPGLVWALKLNKYEIKITVEVCVIEMKPLVFITSLCAAKSTLGLISRHPPGTDNAWPY